MFHMSKKKKSNQNASETGLNIYSILQERLMPSWKCSINIDRQALLRRPQDIIFDHIF